MSNIDGQYDISASIKPIEIGDDPLAKLKNGEPTSVTNDSGDLADQLCNSFPKTSNQITSAGDLTDVEFLSPALMSKPDILCPTNDEEEIPMTRSPSYVSVAKSECHEVFI